MKCLIIDLTNKIKDFKESEKNIFVEIYHKINTIRKE